MELPPCHAGATAFGLMTVCHLSKERKKEARKED
jgi:hypothetical protein